jgi:hypothetical protein
MSKFLKEFQKKSNKGPEWGKEDNEGYKREIQ